mmetsp:Transcript_83881/g.218371  ORF Transcript_83881/g.218371 Transcript_83881/m.218371 type:complete len:203 (+) Transcript_83881:706-1314(+)
MDSNPPVLFCLGNWAALAKVEGFQGLRPTSGTAGDLAAPQVGEVTTAADPNRCFCRAEWAAVAASPAFCPRRQKLAVAAAAAAAASPSFCPRHQKLAMAAAVAVVAAAMHPIAALPPHRPALVFSLRAAGVLHREGAEAAGAVGAAAFRHQLPFAPPCCAIRWHRVSCRGAAELTPRAPARRLQRGIGTTAVWNIAGVWSFF